MRRFLLSLVMVFSVLFSMAQYISNGGTLEFVSGGNTIVIGCVGQDFSITIVEDDTDIDRFEPIDAGCPTLTYSDGILSAGVLPGQQASYKYQIYDIEDRDLGQLSLVVLEFPEAPTISINESTFIIGNQYQFAASQAQHYLWSVETSEIHGYTFAGQDSTSQYAKISFSQVGTYTIKCSVYNNIANGCMSEAGTYFVTVSDGATQQDITYIAPDATLCKGGNMSYTISASGTITSTLTLTIDMEVFTGSLKGDNNYVFDLSGISTMGGLKTAELKADGETVATSTITINTPPDLVILSDESTYFTGVEYTFSSSATAESYAWSMGSYPAGGQYEFVNDFNSQNTQIKFSTAGQYELWCEITDASGCTATNFMYVNVANSGSSNSVTVTNNGSLLFAPGTSATLVGCEGEFATVYFEGEDLDLDQPQSGSGSGQANYDGGGFNSFRFELESAGTYYFNIFPVDQEDDVMVLNVQINEKVEAPTISSTEESFLAGETYVFTANTSTSNVTYEWTLSGLPYDGASIVSNTNSESVSVEFNSALQPGQGTFTLYCEVTSNGCSAIGQKNIEMSSGTTQQDITYTATPQTFCYGDEAEFVVKASQEVEEDYYIMVLLSNSSFYGSHRSDAIDGDEIYFRLNNLPAAEYEVMIYSSDSLNLLVESATMTVGAPIRPTISWEDGDFYVGETVSFYNENYDETLTYTWSVDNADHTFVGATDGEGVSITFLNTGDFVVKCEATENGCTSFDTYSLEVVNAVCSINGKKYGSLVAALDDYENGDEITILSDINEAATNKYIDGYNSFTINTNGHTVTFGEIEVMASITVTGGGVLTTSLSNSDVNGPDVLTVDDATLNLAGTQWMAKNVAITNSGNITLTSNIFLGGGDEDGFNLSIDETSSFNINGQSISGYNATRIAAQIGQYLPRGYTVSDDLVFSPDANVTLSVQSAEPITYTAEAVTTCFNEWDEGEFVVTASDKVEGSYVMTFGTNELTTQRTDGDKIYFELKNIPAGTYNVTVWNSDNSTQLCTSTLTVLDASLNVEGPEEGVTNEPLTFTVTNPVSGVTYEWVVEMYGSDSNSPADPSSYTADSFEGTTFTVTFLEADEYYRIICNSFCGYGTEMALSISEAQPVVSVSFPQDEYEITIGDSTYVCLNITSEEPNFNLDLVTIALDETEGGVQFMETQNKGCFYIKALSTAGSSTKVSATVTYNNEEYYGTTLVRFKEAPFEWENCPDAPLSFEDGSYELQISRWFDVSSYSYSWSSNNEDVATVAADGTVTFVAPGYAEILCTATNLYDQTGVVQAQCPLQIEGETEFTISEISTLSVCQGESATVVITAEPAASFIVVSADNETIYTADNEDYVTLTPTMTTAGDCTYYIVEDGTQKKSFTITVNEKPTVTITALQSVVCVGDTVQLEASMNLSDGSFFWGGADNFDDATSGNPKFVATYDGHYPIFCQVTGAGNCQETAETSLMVYPTPTVTITGPAEAYVGDEVEYTATLAASNMPSTATFTYEWGGGVESYDTETIAKGSFSESDIDNGAEVFCNVATTDGTCSATATYPVVVKAKTEYTISGETTFCAGSKDFITITSEEPINTESFSIETSYNETVPFTINAGDPNVAIIYHASLPTGGYSINIMENRQIVNSFQVQQNIGPQRVSFNCPEEGEAVVGGTWAVSAPQAENYIYYQWSSNGISFENVARQTITFDGEGDVWVVLAIGDENQCVGVSDTCRFTINAGEQKYSAVYPDGEENFTWCHGENSGHVEFDITSNQEIPDGITLKNESGWISNLSVDNYGTSAHFSFYYPYAQNQNFEVIDAQGNTLLTVNGYGNPYIKADITGDTLVVFTSGGDNSLELGTEILEFWNGSYYSANASYIDWTYDDTNISAECLGWKNDDEGTCSQNEMKFTFSETGVYPISFKASSNGCWSDEASKYIYVVPFNPTLFSLSPEKDTIEIGGDGVELSLLYDGTKYVNDFEWIADEQLSVSNGVVTAVDETGTFNVYAVVDGIKVATALITVNEEPVTYEYSGLYMCGEEPAYVYVTASKSFPDAGFIVTDENGNDPERYELLDPNLLLIVCSHEGTYYINDYSSGKRLTQFTVVRSTTPKVFFDCPTDTIVGSSWKPTVSVAEGSSLQYLWESEQITFDKPTTSHQSIYFETAGYTAVTLTGTDRNTGCSGSYTCEFTVVDLPMECNGTLLSLGTTTEFMPLRRTFANDVTDEEETYNLTWKAMPNFTGTIQLTVLDMSDEVGGYQALGTATEFAVVANQMFSINQDLTFSAATSSNPEYVLEVFVPHHADGFEPTSSLIQICESEFSFEKVEQPACEGTFVTFTSAEETYGGTTYYFYESSHDVEIYNASEDDTFEFEWSFTPNFSVNSVSVALVDLSNNNSSSATTYFTEGSNRTQTFNFSLPEGNNEKSTYAIKTTIQSNEIIENATLCESYFSFKKVEKSPYVKVFATEYNQWGSSTDGDNISDGWQAGFDEFPTAVYNATGNTEWNPAIGDVFSLSMQGVANFTGTVNFFMVDQREAAGYWGVASEHVPGFYVVEGEPFNITDYFAVTSTGNDDVTYAPNFVVLCQPNVTSTSDDFSEFVTYKLLLTNYDLSFYPSTATGTCDGNLITMLNSGVVDITNYIDNAINKGDKVTVNWSATPDFTGDLSVALVDGRNTAEDAWLFMTNAISFEVTKDVAFEVSMPFDIIDTHINPFYQMYIAVNDREGSADVYNICSSEITVTIKKEEDIPVECDGNLIKITGQYGDNYHVDGVPTVGDVYDVELTITPNFSGELWLNVTDKSFMNSISKQQEISLVEGVTTETTISFEIIENSSADYSEGFELTKLIRPNSTEGTFYLCESNFSIKKHKELPNYVKVFNLTYDEWGADVDDDEIADNWRTTTIAYESLGVDTYAPGIGDQVEYRFKGVADFTGKISLGLIDNREAACFYAEFSDYNDYYVTEGEEFVIEGSLAVSRIEGSCDESAVELINPLLNISCFPDVTSTNADFTTYKMYSLSLTDYSLVYEQKQVDCYLPMEFDGMNSVVISYVYEDVAVGDEYYAHVTGVSDFTGDLFFSFVDQSEEVGWWYMLDDETKSISVIEGMPFEFEGYFTVTNEVISTQPNIHLTVGRVDDEGTGEITTACATSVEFSKHEQTNNYVKIIKTSYNEYGADRDGDGVSDEWHRDDTSDFSELTNAVYDATGNKVWTPEVGESFFLEMEGVADFTGTVTVLLVDEREEVNWWTELSPYVSFDVTEGEIFNYTTILGIQTIETVEGVALTEPHFQVTCAPDNTSTNSNFVTGKAMTLSFTNFTMDYYPNPSSVCDGNMITIPFYRTSVEKEDEYAYNTYRSVDIESVSKGDEFTLTWSGTADFDGTINVALTDQSEEAYWFTRLSDFYQVAELVEGEKFSLSVPLSIIENASSEPVYKLAIFVVTPKKAAHLTICEDNFSLQKPQAFSIGFDEPGYVFEKVGEEQLICVNISGSYDGDVMYEYDESIIELIDSQYGERCKILKALKPGRTHLFASVMYDGEKREAGAAISVEGSTSNDYTLTFDQKMYEVTEGESFRACLTIGDGFEEFQPEFEFNSDVISIANPTDHSDCGIITGLTAGQTTVVVSAYANGVRYADTTFVIVNQKPALDYTLAFEKRTYEMYEGETVEACMIMGNAFEHDFHPEMVYDETVIAVNEPTEQQSDNCGSITGLKAGNSVLIIYTEIDEERYGDTVFVVVTKKDIQVPQMEVPVVTTNEIKLCYSKTQQDTIMLDAFVQVTSDNARLKWYDAAGNALISAPLIDPKTVGKRIYYVSQIASGYNESEKVALSVNIVYVAAPELNIYEQKVCDNTETKAFVAKSQNNEIYWYQGEGNPIAQNTNTFMPSEAGTYLVRAIDVANGCVSDFATVSYAVGHTIRPQIEVEKTEYALDEEIVLAVQSVDEEQYGVVWTIEGEVVQGTTATVAFAEEGNYKIPCTIVEKESGCYASDTVEISVKNTNIPVAAITVEPSAIELYEGEQSYLALSFTPAFATDRNYNIEIADTSIADVVGLTVFGLKEGETTATISSTSNSSASASITITVKKFIAAREISLPTVITMSPEETKTISAAVLPTNASYNEVFFTEKEDNVIRLSANGELTALAEGTSIITAYTKGGLKASSVVVVTSSVAAITDIQVPERIEMKVGDSVSVSYKVVPATSLISQLNWAIGDEEMISFANGVVKAEKAGSTTLTVSFASIEKSIAIVVNESDAPVVITTPNVSATQGNDIKVDLTDVISDDNTAIEDLTVTTTSDKFDVTVENGVLTVIPKDNSFVGVDTVTVVVIDENNLSVELPVVVEITGIQNQAPEILMDTIMIKYNACNYIQLSELVSDDFTPYNKMKYSFTSNVKASVMLRKQLRLFTDNPDLESDILTMTVTDAEGVSTTKEILLLLTALPNKAPKIAEIPTQNENDESKFGTIDLAQYVKDDYTSSSAIAWSAADAENLAVTISDGKATVKVLNEFWNGAAAVTFYAKDEEGLTDSTVVYYVRNVTIKKEDPSQEPTTEVVATWEGAPSFDFMTMKTIGVPGAQFILMASCSGYECTWSWDIPGAKGVDPTSLMQMITFDEPGTYDVTFTVQSPDGNFEKSITKENFLTVVGISERTPAICKGEAVVLTATEGLDSYYWSTGDVKNTTSDRPEETALYQVTMKKGMFTLIDTVTVKVSVPVSLMEDSVMCKGTTFDLEAEGEFVSYTWNTGESTKAIALPDVIASYSVMAVDDMQCVSVDTFNLTTVNELPVIDLGPDQTPCDGTTVTLDAGTGFDYLWKNGSTEQTISLTAGTDTVWARIIDNNLCVNYDTVVVAFTYPYAEQIGVATFSETTDHIILAWEKTAGVNTVKYRIERETNVTDNWEKVGDDVMFAEAGLVVDEDVNYKQRAYKYRLVTTDGCGNEAVSEVHRSMISTTTRNDDGTKTLQWCAYEPMANVTQYLVLRGYDATAMDTVDQVPASNLYEIWNETDSKFVNDKDIKYRVVFRLKSEVNENAVNTLEGQPVEGYYTKAESGPFSLALSNIAEAENGLDVEEVPFADVVVYPTTFSSYINVAIAATVETNFKVEILNANGQLMARTQTGDINKTLLQIPTDNFKQGVYTVKISDGQQTKTLKVVK